MRDFAAATTFTGGPAEYHGHWSAYGSKSKPDGKNPNATGHPPSMVTLPDELTEHMSDSYLRASKTSLWLAHLEPWALI